MNERREPQPEARGDVLAGLTDEQVRSAQETWLTLIEHINPRIWYAETRRSTFASLAAGLLGAGIALLTAILLNSVSYRPAFWALLFIALGAIGTGAVVFFVYAAQTNYDYPFKKKTSTWKWFYRDALPRTKQLSVPWLPWRSLERGASRQKAEELFDVEWTDFVTQQREVVNLRISAMQDLQQLYVLHINEFYKNRFLTQIRKVLTAGLAVMLIAGTLAFLVALGARAATPSTPPAHTHTATVGGK